MKTFGLIITLLGAVDNLIYLIAIRTNVFGKAKNIIIKITLVVIGILLLLSFICRFFF